MAEWFKAVDSKSIEGFLLLRGFKSYLLRQIVQLNYEKYLAETESIISILTKIVKTTLSNVK